MIDFTSNELQQKIQDIRACLSDDLLKPKYRGKPFPTGHCYVATEVMYHLLGGKESGWKPMFVRYKDTPHWYLTKMVGKYSSIIVDVTADQFKDKPLYHGKGKGFLTKHPSKRAQIVIDRYLKLIEKRESQHHRGPHEIQCATTCPVPGCPWAGL